jgi:HK97 family phage portal protein
MVLEGGLKYQGVTMNPKMLRCWKAAHLALRKSAAGFACRLSWLVTPRNKAAGHPAWGMNLQFLTHTLRPLLVNIEQEIGRCLLDSDDEVFAEFSVEGLLRADSAGRAAYYTSALQNGWMSRNDVRRLENMPPIEGAIFTPFSST